MINILLIMMIKPRPEEFGETLKKVADLTAGGSRPKPLERNTSILILLLLLLLLVLVVVVVVVLLLLLLLILLVFLGANV